MDIKAPALQPKQLRRLPLVTVPNRTCAISTYDAEDDLQPWTGWRAPLTSYLFSIPYTNSAKVEKPQFGDWSPLQETALYYRASSN